MGRPRKLDGTLTRKQRVEIAKDVIALCKSSQRKIRIDVGAYFFTSSVSRERALLSEGGQLTSRRLPTCEVCARGALFIASVDRYDRCDLGDIDNISVAVQDRTREEWGRNQVLAIEAAFEEWDDDGPSGRPKARLLAIMENIVANNGEYKP